MSLALEGLGWDAGWREAFAPWAADGCVPGRVASEHQHLYRVLAEAGELVAAVSGRFRHEHDRRADYPAVGDWVALAPRPEERRGTIHGVLPRRSRFSRREAGEDGAEQVVAANVDTVFLAMGLDLNYNLRRLERALLLARESGARPVVLLTKTDLCDDVPGRVAEAAASASGAPVHALSPKRAEGLEALALYLAPGRTVALLGSSGVGKSTLINALLGEERQRTRDVRAKDARGRHATSHRELVPLPGGALVVDTPGMREMQLWAEESALPGTFAEIDALAAGCAFRDCRHVAEPRCAVRAAVAEGRLPAARLESYRKLQRELAALEARHDRAAHLEQKRKWKAIHKAARTHKPRA
jgi:ribosome biogenesis GTPase